MKMKMLRKCQIAIETGGCRIEWNSILTILKRKIRFSSISTPRTHTHNSNWFSHSFNHSFSLFEPWRNNWICSIISSHNTRASSWLGTPTPPPVPIKLDESILNACNFASFNLNLFVFPFLPIWRLRLCSKTLHIPFELQSTYTQRAWQTHWTHPSYHH